MDPMKTHSDRTHFYTANNMEVEPMKLTDLTNDALGLVVNHASLKSRDQANAARTCKRVRAAVVIQHVVFKKPTPVCVRDMLTSALKGGRVKTLNVRDVCLGGGDIDPVPVHASVLTMVGEDAPDLVASLQEARVWWITGYTLRGPAFKALTKIYAMNRIVNPSTAHDERLALDDVVVQNPDAALDVSRRWPIGALTVFIEEEDSCACLERAHAEGQRAVNVIAKSKGWAIIDIEPNVADRFARAVVQMATKNVYSSSPRLSLAIARHIALSPTVTTLALVASAGLLEALERALGASAPTRASPLTLGMAWSWTEDLQPGDWVALDRMLTRGAVNALHLSIQKHHTSTFGLHGHIILKAPTVGIGMRSAEHAIELFEQCPESGLEALTLHIWMAVPANGVHPSRDVLVPQFAKLAETLSARPALRAVTLRRNKRACVIPDAAFDAFVERMDTRIHVSIEHHEAYSETHFKMGHPPP